MTSSPLSKFRSHAAGGWLPRAEGHTVAWQSPSNIALVKYWGKKNGQFPLTPSLSMTLNRAITRTRLHAVADKQVKGLVSVNGEPDHPFLPKMQQLFQWLAGEIPVLKELTLSVNTENSFPHSTGIASSASGISAFALCLIDLAANMHAVQVDMPELMHMASYAAREGSGSASRSLFGGYTVWGSAPAVTGSSDDFAVPVPEFVHPEMTTLKDAILVISSDPKSLPSTRGHILMEGHPFTGNRIGQANHNLQEALHALHANDFEKLAATAECEALTLHALIMSADPGTLLMRPATVEAIHRIRAARRQGLPLFFTLDAGASVHVMYMSAAAGDAEKFIRDSLQPLCEGGRVIFDGCGSGPAKINEPALIP